MLDSGRAKPSSQHAEKRVVSILLFIAAIYFLVFAFPNSTGASDASMISIFEPDEFAQYTYLTRMLAFDAGDLKHNLYDFVAYGHYYYGYPFYLGSAITLLPMRLMADLNNKNTQAPLMLLRQCISVLPMLAAILVMTYSQTKFRSLLPSLVTLLLLLAIPAVIENNMWWHPDSLATLFVVLTIFFLDRDDLKFGRNFLFAAVACGLATATKVLGLFFVLAIPVYLVLGIERAGLTWAQAALKAAQFVALMVASIVAANPFMLIPSQLRDMLGILSGQASAMSVGWVLHYAKGPESWMPIITRLYAGSLFLGLSVALVVVTALRRGPGQVLHLMILCWMAPLSVYILFSVAIKPTHFFLPIIIPLASCIPAALQTWRMPVRSALPSAESGRQRMSAPWLLIAAGASVVQIGWSLPVDAALYRDVLGRETSEPRVAHYAELNRRLLKAIPDEQPLLIYRDVRMYFPQTRNRRVRTFFNTTTYENIERMEPDIIVLWSQRIADYTTESAEQNAIAPDTFREVQRFFADARAGDLEGYHLLLQDAAGVSFLKDEVYESYFGN